MWKMRSVLIAIPLLIVSSVVYADNGSTSPPKRNVFAKVHGEFDKGPIPRFQASAIYPPSLEAKGVQGAAVVSFTIGLDGKVSNIAVGNATDAEFASAAVAAAKRDSFIPAQKGGAPVICTMDLLFTFPGPFVVGGSKH